MKISNLLYKEDKWTKNALARNKDGKPIESLNICHFANGVSKDPSKDAYSFSLYGAAAHLYSGEGLQDVLIKLGNAARLHSGKRVWLAEFNDSTSTTFEDIKKVLALAQL